jgi:hypothetical protein
VYYEEKCCHAPNRVLPQCEEIKHIYYGGEPPKDKDWYELHYPGNTPGYTGDRPGVIFIPVGTRQGYCGDHVKKWDVKQQNCCDEVEPLAIDTERSVSVLAPGTHGNVYFSGGKFPVLVRVRGNGFTLDGYNQRDGWVDGPGRGFTIFAHEFACGSCPITISDGCTTAHYSLRATVGHWDGWCVTYRWQRPRLTGVSNRNVYGVRYDSDRCTYTHYLLASGYTGMVEDRDPYAGGSVNLVSFYRWEGGWTAHANSLGLGMIQDPDLLPGEFDKVIAHCEGLGIPHDTHPNVYAPNGPADIYSVCSAPAYPCRFIC